MMFTKSLAIFAFSAVAEAHFRVAYPFWRGDSFATGRSQWSWPCANVTQENSSTNRTSWPLEGGSVVLSSSHEYVITYINLGLGDAVTGFNVSLLAAYNATGNGTIRFDGVGTDVLPSLNLTDGQTASLQFVHIGDRGNALYNCADIVFSANATTPAPEAYTNSTGVGGFFLTDSAAAGGEHDHSGTSGSESASATTSSGGAAATTGAASNQRVGMAALVGGAAVAVGALIV